MPNVHINKISKILQGESWEYLYTPNTNQSFNIFHNRLTEILDQVSPEITFKISEKCKCKDLWVITGLHKSAKNCLNFIRNQLR